MHIHYGNERWHQAAALALRYIVFVCEQGIALEDEFDVFDTPSCHYFVVYQNKRAIATARYQMISEKVIQPDRLCVEKDYRNKKIGTTLLRKIEAVAIQKGCSKAVLSAEKSAISFYQKLGYQICSEEYYEDGILCLKVEKNLTG